MVDRIVTATSDRRDVILDVIRGAKRQLALSLFRCNDDQIFQELGHAVERGVAVNVLTTARAKGGRKRLETLWSALAGTGATVHAYGDPVVKYHAKYLVADDGPAVVASLNFTRKCFNRTWDAIVVTDDAEVVSGLQALLAADREGRALPQPLTPRLIVGPERARQQFSELIRSAQESIRIVDAKLSDPDLVALLNTRRTEGIRVQIVDSKRVGERKCHGKMMLVDSRIAVVGSIALAALALDFRREVAITVDAPDALAALGKAFDEMHDISRADRAMTSDPRRETIT